MSKEAPRASIPNLELLPPLLSLWKQFLFELTYFHVPSAAEGEAMSGGRGGEGGVADLSRGGGTISASSSPGSSLPQLRPPERPKPTTTTNDHQHHPRITKRPRKKG